MKRLLRTLILLLIRLIGLPGALSAAKKAQKPVPATPRILLLRPDHLGDLVLTTPVLQALKMRAPSAHLTMMVGPWSSEVVARHAAIDQLLTCSFPGFQRAVQRPFAPYILLFKTARQLRRGDYDIAINLRPDFWWGAALLYLAGITRRVGFALTPGAQFLTSALPFQSPEHATVSNLRLTSAALEAAGYAPLPQLYTPERYPLLFRPSSDEQNWVADRLRQAEIDTNEPFVVIHPGSGAAVKLWRPAAWAACANALPEVLPNHSPVHILLTGSKSEQPMLEEIARDMTSVPLLITDATIGQLAALLEQAQLVLGVDSGPLHIAIAQNTPTVQIFGPTDPHIFGPWGSSERHIVIASTSRCPTCPAIPCGRLDFAPVELPAHPCVRLISEQEVLKAVKRLVPFVTRNIDLGQKTP